MEKYRSMRVAYFTDNLDLTPDEAEKFWPLYNKYDNQKEELRNNRRMIMREYHQEGREITEEEAEVFTDRHIEMKQKDIEVDIEFHKELKTVLTANKIMQFYITEVQFREYMLKRIREDRGNAGRGHGRQ